MSSPRIRYQEAMNNARAALASEQFEDAEQAFRSALRARGGDAPARAGLGHALRRQRREAEALVHLRQAAVQLSKMPTSPGEDAFLDVAFEMQEALAPRESLRLIERVLSRTQRSARAYHLLARANLRLGRPAEALIASRRAVALAPEAVNAALLLAEAEIATAEITAAIERLRVLSLPRTSAEQIQRLRLLGAASDAHGDYRQAFAYVQEAGQLALERLPVRVRRPLAAGLARTLEICTRAYFEQHADENSAAAGPSPIFMIGYLRSGTTLLEQVFGAHPRVIVSNEADLVPTVLKELARLSGGDDHWTDQIARIGAAGVQQLRHCYWRTAEARLGRLPQNTLLLDKTALNTLNAALLNVLFPRATLLFVSRDPRDVCISCFMQSFDASPLTLPWLNWEEGVQAYSQVMEFWRAMRAQLTLPIHTIRYESVVSDLRGTLAPVFAALGLEWQEACAQPHLHQRAQAVRTPSFAQVAQPLYGHAAGRWRRYAEAFSRVMPQLEPALRDLEYG